MVERARHDKPPLHPKSALTNRPSRHSIPFFNIPQPPRPSMTVADPPHSSPPPHSPSISRLLILASLAVLLLVLLAFLTTPLLLTSLPRFLRPLPLNRYEPGYSIVAACSNRLPSLARALPSWLRVTNLNQIIIIDWSSSTPLQPFVHNLVKTVPDPPSVRLIRVQNESHWVLSRAYNLAIHHATSQFIFKVDCDYVVRPDFFENHPFPDAHSIFYTGHYMNARHANEIHLNGALLISQKNFWGVGGYDERIHTYGYDDDDLYDRLVRHNFTRKNVSYDHVSHIDHQDSSRAQQGVKFPRVQIDINRLLLERINKPWQRTSRPSQYEATDVKRNMLHAIYVPSPLKSLVDVQTFTELRKLSLGRRLRDDFLLPWEIISLMDMSTAEKLLQSMNARRNMAHFDEVLQRDLAPRFILIHVQNGLGNRLRSMASGLAFAEHTKREPIIVWEKDVHFGAFYSDIFNYSVTPFVVLNTFSPSWPLAENRADAAWQSIDYYNYMLPSDVDKFVVDNQSKNIYFKSPAIINSNLTSWESENVQLRNLQVVDDIVVTASQVYSRHDMSTMGGVQIRNRSLDHDIPGVNNREMYTKQEAALLDKWRAKSKVHNFEDTMRAMLRNGTVEKFFVASDTIGVCKKLRDVFSSDKIEFISRQCDGRGVECEKLAMADLLVLSKTKVLLGSTWSSFTEAAMRLGGPKALLAGTDFGEKPAQIS